MHFNFQMKTRRERWRRFPHPHIVSYHGSLLKGNYIDETVRQWLICTITHCDIPGSAFCSSLSDGQLLTIDQRLHLRVEWQYQFISSYWVSANNNWYLAHVSQRHLSAIRELINRLAVCLWKREEKCKICLWICSLPWRGEKGNALPSLAKFNLFRWPCAPANLFTFNTVLALFFIDNHVNN